MNQQKVCCVLTLSRIEVSNIVFYDLKNKLIVDFGSSEIGHHSVCANIHAEEIALNKISKHIYLNKFKKSYNKHIILYIWKINAKKEMFPAFTCSWCAGLIRKHKFPVDNVITLNAQKAYIINSTDPLKKKDI